MSWLLNADNALPKKAASTIQACVPVKADTVKDQVVLAAAVGDDVIGITVATAASPGNPIAVYAEGAVAPALCAASIGAGGAAGIASNNGALGPVAAASGTDKRVVGVAQEAAAAGGVFSVLIRPRQVSGNP